MGGLAFYGPCGGDAPIDEESDFEISANPRYTVDVPKFETLIYIMKHFPDIITDIPEESILDRSESSSLSKAILIVQVGWFCTNCASRLTQGLPLSLFEISTAAHACCTLLTYFVGWSKPNNVAAPTLMRGKGAQEVYALLKCSESEYGVALVLANRQAAGDSSPPTRLHASARIVLAANALQRLLPTPEQPPFRSVFRYYDGTMAPGTFLNKSRNMGMFLTINTAISPILYGLVHFLAWSDQFPTPLERLLWRVSSFVVTLSGLVGVSFLWSIMMLQERFGSSGKLIYLKFYMSFVVMPTVHTLASGFLIVESFRQLFFLNSAAYQLPSWSNYWPHLS